MRPLLLLVFCALCVAALISLPSSPVAAAERTTISGGSLARPISLSPLDEQAFFQRINMPPKLDDAPSAAGQDYTISSPYWDTVLRGNDKDAKTVQADAHYYPDGGFVRASQGGEDVWLVIDLRQRAVLDRYIRLGENGALTAQTPATLDVLSVASAGGEEIGIQVGNRTISSDTRADFWKAATGVTSATPVAPSAGADGLWITFNLVEGRSVEFLYSPPQHTLVDASGLEAYSVPASFDAYIQSLGATTAQPVAQDAGRGSPLWWPLGLGIAAALFATAVWLQRRISGEEMKSAG